MEPVKPDRGMMILPTTTFDTCPELDVICIPGRPGQTDLMEDEETLEAAGGCSSNTPG